MKRIWYAAAIGALVLGASCGNRGAPNPPLPSLPLTPREPVYRQRGDELQVRATYTLTRLRGRDLRPPARAELLVVSVPAGDSASAWLSPFRDREFIRTAKPYPLAEFEAADLGSSVLDERAIPLSSLPPAGRFVVALALADASARSIPAGRIPLEPARPGLTPPEGFAAEPEERGIRLRWAGADERAERILIYRGAGGEIDRWKPWRIVPLGSRETLDEIARYGETLVYEITAAPAAKGGAEVTIESTAVASAVIEYTDRFPPSRARDAAAVAETNAIRVLWTPGGSKDESHALVLRQAGGDPEAPWEEIGRTDIPDAFFIDRDVDLSTLYRYRLVSVDTSGNRSEPSEPSGEWVSPRPDRGGDGAP